MIEKRNHFLISIESNVHYKQTFTALLSKTVTVYTLQTGGRLQNIKNFAISVLKYFLLNKAILSVR